MSLPRVTEPIASRTSGRERGFTLVELLVSVTILGIIIGSITATFTVLSRTADSTQSRFTQSRGLKFANGYWVPDVASSESVNPTARCGNAGTVLVTFKWTDIIDPSVVRVATWSKVTSGSDTSLVRSLCTLDALSSPLTTTIAPQINASATQVACVTAGVSGSCATDSAPSQVNLTLATADGRTFQLLGTRKVG
jgi:prepilin-type N-terminal cleavage/methylation domain-containing protein